MPLPNQGLPGACAPSRDLFEAAWPGQPDRRQQRQGGQREGGQQRPAQHLGADVLSLGHGAERAADAFIHRIQRTGALGVVGPPAGAVCSVCSVWALGGTGSCRPSISTVPSGVPNAMVETMRAAGRASWSEIEMRSPRPLWMRSSAWPPSSPGSSGPAASCPKPDHGSRTIIDLNIRRLDRLGQSP